MSSLTTALLGISLAAAPLAPLCTADLGIGAEAPTTAVTGCEVASNVGIAIDGSGSIGAGNFATILQSVSNFIATTSGTAGGGPANANVYYVNTFSSSVVATSQVVPNDGDTQAAFVEQLQYPGGNTDIAAALDDQLAQLEAFAPATVVLITDGASGVPFDAQAAALAAADLTLVCVGIGNADVATLEQLCATDAAGAPLVFSSDEIADVALVLENALVNIDSDGDGIPDCEDECPGDPTKTEAPCEDLAPPPRNPPPPVRGEGMYGEGMYGEGMYGDDVREGMYGF